MRNGGAATDLGTAGAAHTADIGAGVVDRTAKASGFAAGDGGIGDGIGATE